MPSLLSDLSILDKKLDRQEKKFNKALESRYDKLESITLRQAGSIKSGKEIVIPASNIQGLENSLKQHFKEVSNIAAGNTRRELSGLVNTQVEKDKILSIVPDKNSKSDLLYARDLAKKQVDDYKKKVTDRINQALELNPNLSTKDIKRIIQDETLSFKNVRVSATSETEANRVTNNTRLELFKKAGISKKKFTAILDNRTSNFCKEHNGKVYGIDEGPGLPAHIRCRSYYVAIKEK